MTLEPGLREPQKSDQGVNHGKENQENKASWQAKKRGIKAKAAQSPTIIFEISGRVINHETGLRAADVQIEVWHKGGPLKTDNKLIGPLTLLKTAAEGDFSHHGHC